MTQRDGAVRVLMCIPNLNGGGAERTTLNVAGALEGSRVHARVMAHERWGGLLDSLDPKIDIVFAHDGEYHRRHLPGLLAATLRHGSEADVIVGANEGRASFFAILAARALGKPLVLWLHNDWGRFKNNVSWRQRASLRLYDEAAAIVACSEGVAEAFARLMPQSRHKLVTIYNGIPTAHIRGRAAEPLDPAHVPLFAGPTVITAGRLDYQKGHEFLIAAHALLLGRGVDHRLLILGGGPLKGELERKVKEARVEGSVHFLGFQTNPHRLLARATVFALSSRFEGFPMVLGEALACGVPVVSADCPSGPREMLADGAAGILVKPESPEALADGLERVLKSPDERRRLAQAALDRVPYIELARIARQWEELLVALPPGRPSILGRLWPRAPEAFS